jgi:hypothetical protein
MSSDYEAKAALIIACSTAIAGIVAACKKNVKTCKIGNCCMVEQTPEGEASSSMMEEILKRINRTPRVQKTDKMTQTDDPEEGTSHGKHSFNPISS